MVGLQMTPELYQQVSDMLRWFRDRRPDESLDPLPARMPSRFPLRAVILDAALEAATVLTPKMGAATRLEWSDTDNRYTQLGETIDVWNHSAESHEADTPGAAIWIDGHYWFFGDCDPWDDRPDPPAAGGA